MKNDLSQIRKEYSRRSLSREAVLEDPLKQLQQWLDEAIRSEVMEPTAMTLATVSKQGRPSARTVLLKEITKAGVVFYTNYHSRKAQQMTIRPFAALVLFWPELERQVRLEGRVEKVAPEKSDKYFRSRPYSSQLGAWVSNQSEVIPNRNQLEKKMEKLSERFKQHSMYRPPHWGGYQLFPDRMEFWQGRRSRLHDRIEYLKEAKGWLIRRLSP